MEQEKIPFQVVLLPTSSVKCLSDIYYYFVMCRCYAILRADMSALVYEKCFILCAGLDYDHADTTAEDKRHLTNLSINKKLPGHPGQVPCWLARECPEVGYTWCNHLIAIFSQLI
jgi:hypothetical protein